MCSRNARLLALALLIAASAGAQLPPPVGGEFQVNTYTTSDQDSVSVSPDGAGALVVVWDSEGSSGTDSSATSIQGQRYATDGSPADSQFQVNTYTSDFQFDAAVSPDGAGGFVVTWLSFGSSGTDSSGSSIQGQRYTADGSPADSQFQVNTYTSDIQLQPSVSPNGAGGFVVAWASQGSSGTDSSYGSIQGQRYAPDGAPAGGEFQVNTYTTSSQRTPSVSPDGTGGFVVTWQSQGSSGTDSSYGSIQGQRYAADGSPVGGEFQVNTYTTSYQGYPSVSPDGSGGFVVAWQSMGSSGTDSSSLSIQGQRYAPDGTPAGAQFQVNTHTTSYQIRPSVGSDGAGGFVVTWWSGTSSGTDTSYGSIQGQRYAPEGSPVGGEFQVNTYTTSFQRYPAVSPNGVGGFIVTWDSNGSSGTDTSSFSIQGQRFESPEIFADGFESGDTSAWSNSVP